MVTLVATLGTGSMDLYAQKLSEHLHVPKVYSDIYQRNAKLFNIPFTSRSAMKAAREDWHFIRRLNQENSILHLPNHHLGR
jgi:predicted transglutaminase-like cysteine proteinase